MSVIDVTMKQVCCDGRLNEDSSPCPAEPNDEIMAWVDEETAIRDAEDAGWEITDDGRHFCPDHRTSPRSDVDPDDIRF